MSDNGKKPLVRVSHFRVPEGMVDECHEYSRRRKWINDNGRFMDVRPQSCGGATNARVTLESTTFVYSAWCSLKDQFNYRLGRQIACGRLRKALTVAGIDPDTVVWPV